MGVAMSVTELAALSVMQVADLVSNSSLSEYRQAGIDFGIDGDMLTRLPVDQLADALGRAGVDDEQHLVFLLAEIENVSGHRGIKGATHSSACKGVNTFVTAEHPPIQSKIEAPVTGDTCDFGNAV